MMIIYSCELYSSLINCSLFIYHASLLLLHPALLKGFWNILGKVEWVNYIACATQLIWFCRDILRKVDSELESKTRWEGPVRYFFANQISLTVLSSPVYFNLGKNISSQLSTPTFHHRLNWDGGTYIVPTSITLNVQDRVIEQWRVDLEEDQLFNCPREQAWL